MAVSEALEKHWRDAFAKEQLPRRDALEKAMAGVLPIEGDPLRDPLFLPADVAERRESIMLQLAAWEESSLPVGFDMPMIKDGNRLYHAHDYFLWQHQTAYELLCRRVDIRTIAATVHREPAWVKAIADQYHLN